MFMVDMFIGDCHLTVGLAKAAQVQILRMSRGHKGRAVLIYADSVESLGFQLPR